MSNVSKGFFRRREKTSSVEKAAQKLSDAALMEVANGSRSATTNAHFSGGTAAVANDGIGDGTFTRQVEIDHEALRAAGMISARWERSQIAEEFRLIKRPLLLKAFDRNTPAAKHGNLIMITSARPGEGKTFSAINLAMSIALERDLTVMLIDADIARPSVPTVLGFEAEYGLIDLITDDSLSMSDVLLRTDIENLTVLPAGRAHNLATELFASERMELFVDEISKRYRDRVIIVDSPPVLMSSIPAVLALHVGQIVFIVQAEKSTQAAVDGALSLIGGCENIYLLLNKARSMGDADRFEGYYEYYR
jgi:receptor protein-tyrosine kinase